MKALDSSVVVAALLSWHDAHEAAHRAAAGNAVPAHALLETYAVLTRLPAPHRLAPADAEMLLAGWFPPERVLLPSARLTTGIVTRFARAGVSGGACYDALVGLTASGHGLALLTRDQRAARTYDALQIEHVMVTS